MGLVGIVDHPWGRPAVPIRRFGHIRTMQCALPRSPAILLSMDFEWDPGKAAANEHKHGVSFSEAATVFGAPLSITVSDPDHSGDDERSITVGSSVSGRLLIIAHADRDDRVRIISARLLTRRERESYESGDFE